MYARASFRLVFVVAISKGRKRVEKMDEYEDKYSDVDEDEEETEAPENEAPLAD